MAYIILPAVIVGLGSMLYGQFKYNTAEAEPLAETPVNKAVDVQKNFAWNAKKRVVGIAAFLIALVAIIVMIIILKNTGEVTDINEIPGERVELDSGGIILEW